MTTDADWASVATAIGRPGKLAADGTSYRVGLPRRDLTVTSGGLPVTAIHKHLLAESPPLWWVHVAGMGNAVHLAGVVKAALDKTATPPPAPAGPPGSVDLDTAGIDAALGGKGSVDGGVYKLTFARRDTITEGHYVVPPGLGVTTGLNFQPHGEGRAAINGDFAMTAGEVQHILATLRGVGITVVSLHNHALDDSPRLFYTHFWATSDGVALAKGLRAAVDQTAVRR